MPEISPELAKDEVPMPRSSNTGDANIMETVRGFIRVMEAGIGSGFAGRWMKAATATRLPF